MNGILMGYEWDNIQDAVDGCEILHQLMVNIPIPLVVQDFAAIHSNGTWYIYRGGFHSWPCLITKG